MNTEILHSFQYANTLFLRYRLTVIRIRQTGIETAVFSSNIKSKRIPEAFIHDPKSRNLLRKFLSVLLSVRELKKAQLKSLSTLFFSPLINSTQPLIFPVRVIGFQGAISRQLNRYNFLCQFIFCTFLRT